MDVTTTSGCALEEIVDAYRYVETGQKIGRVVITVSVKAETVDG